MTHQEPPQMLPAAADSCELPLQTRMDVRLMPDTAVAEKGGPFRTDYEIDCSALVVPKTIDLEATSQ